MKIRVSHIPLKQNSHEHGVTCKCGYNLFFDESELTPPVTKITCPNCSFEINYHTPSLAGKEKFGSDVFR